MIRELQTVVLTHDIKEFDLKMSDIGTVVHRHGGAEFEVEFRMTGGRSKAVITLTGNDLLSENLGSEEVPSGKSTEHPYDQQIQEEILPFLQDTAFNHLGHLKRGLLSTFSVMLDQYCSIDCDATTLSLALHGHGLGFARLFKDPNFRTLTTVYFNLANDNDYLEACSFLRLSLPSAERLKAFRELSRKIPELVSSRYPGGRTPPLNMESMLFSKLFEMLLCYSHAIAGFSNAIYRSNLILEEELLC